MAKGYVYLLECVSNYETSYKIGYTRNKDIKKRIISLQTGNKDKIRCIDSFESQNYAKQIETALHNFYSYIREGGEWFELEYSDVNKFQSICKKMEENFDLLEKYNNNFI